MKTLRDDSDIGSLPYAGRDPCIYWGKRKFGVRVYKTGAKTFVLAYTDDNGKKRLLTLGRYPDMRRESAEDSVGAYRLEIKDGRNPVEEQRAVASSDKSETHCIANDDGSVSMRVLSEPTCKYQCYGGPDEEERMVGPDDYDGAEFQPMPLEPPPHHGFRP